MKVPVNSSCRVSSPSAQPRAAAHVEGDAGVAPGVVEVVELEGDEQVSALDGRVDQRLDGGGLGEGQDKTLGHFRSLGDQLARTNKSHCHGTRRQVFSNRNGVPGGDGLPK